MLYVWLPNDNWSAFLAPDLRWHSFAVIWASDVTNYIRVTLLFTLWATKTETPKHILVHLLTSDDIHWGDSMNHAMSLIRWFGDVWRWLMILNIRRKANAVVQTFCLSNRSHMTNTFWTRPNCVWTQLAPFSMRKLTQLIAWWIGYWNAPCDVAETLHAMQSSLADACGPTTTASIPALHYISLPQSKSHATRATACVLWHHQWQQQSEWTAGPMAGLQLFRPTTRPCSSYLDIFSVIVM